MVPVCRTYQPCFFIFLFIRNTKLKSVLPVHCVPWVDLPADENSTSANENTTLVEIAQFQLNLWTGVGLALVAFLAIYMTMNMDVQPDSLLYAKFIADTSGGGLKTD